MEINESNKIIADYMGERVDVNTYGTQIGCVTCDHCEEYRVIYSDSLDALVPVWEKLECFIDISGRKNNKEKAEVFMPYMKTGLYETGETIQQAACIATAKAIQNLDT